MKRSTLLLALPLCCLLDLGAASGQGTPVILDQDTLNRTDEQGRKQGYWKVTAPSADDPGYPQGQVVEEGRYVNSRRVGVWRTYWPNGKVKSEITYQMGRPKGEYQIYYPNGKVEEEGTWDLDRNIGTFKRWHPNGKLAQDFVFDQNGVRDGEQKYYHENGQLAVQVEIEQGREDGTLKRYYANGDVQQVAEFNDGVINKANSKWIKPVHKPASTPAPAADARPAPPPTQAEATNAVLFRENGHNTLYDKQLRITQQGVFKEGRLWNGTFRRYDANGILNRIEVYEGGRYIGVRPITDEDLK